MSYILRKATSDDLIAIKEIVTDAGLTANGIEENIHEFFIMEDENEEISTIAGIEGVGEIALLRSLVFTKDTKIQDLALFFKTLVETAKSKGYTSIYLLTKQKSSPQLLKWFGFKETKDIPEQLRSFEHFQRFENSEETITMVHN